MWQTGFVPDDWSDRRDALPQGCVLRDYTIEEVLGHGGFGIVYKARHNELDHVVAIKEYLPSELAVREGATIRAKSGECEAQFADGLRRFREEAKALIEFQQHPSIVDCREFFRANGTAYLVMEYVEGLPLSELLRQREAAGKPFTEHDLLDVAIPLAQGLAHIHRAGVIHRDIKPANILVRKSDQQPVLIDFGAAKQAVAEHSRSLAPYTEGYAALEQVADGQLGPWTDLYGFGAVLWRMVAGSNPPWDPPNPVKVESRANARVREAGDPLPTANELGAGRFAERILEMIDGCLQLRDTERIRESARVVEVLQGSGGERPQSATAEPQPEGSADVDQQPSGRAEAQPGRTSTGRWWKIVGVATAAIVAVALAAVALIPGDKYSESTEAWSFRVDPEPATATVALLNGPEAYRPGMPLIPGRYEVEVSAAGFVTRREWVKHAESETLLQVQLERLPDAVPELAQDPSGADAEALESIAPEQGRVPSNVSDPKQPLVEPQLERVQTPSDAVGNREVANPTTVEDEQVSRERSSVGKVVVTDSAVASDSEKTDKEEVSPTDCGTGSKGRTDCFELGVSYWKGQGVPLDAARAAEFFGQACDSGHALACSHLGFLYDTGEGVGADKALAAESYSRACDGGDATGCYNLGLVYYNGEGVAEDKTRAAVLYSRACERGGAMGCNNLGFLYDIGEGVGEDKVRAAELYRQACDGGEVMGCNNLGYLYSNGTGVAEDKAAAAELYRRSCEGGNATGCASLGFRYAKGEGVEKDTARAVDLYRQACDGGEAISCHNLGYMYSNGEGVAEDKAAAAELYRQSCEGGAALGCHNLGIGYYLGEGVDENHTLAAQLFERACEGGNAAGCHSLGLRYSNGEGVGLDQARAAELYDQACKGGQFQGCSSLADLYYGGVGVPQDRTRAAELSERACEGGDSLGCYNLGVLYSRGAGVDEDQARAAELYQQACEGGYDTGCYNLGLMYYSGDRIKQDRSVAHGLFQKACGRGYQEACEQLEALDWR